MWYLVVQFEFLCYKETTGLMDYFSYGGYCVGVSVLI